MAAVFILGLIAALAAAIVGGAYGFVAWERRTIARGPEIPETPLSF